MINNSSECEKCFRVVNVINEEGLCDECQLEIWEQEHKELEREYLAGRL